MEQICAKIYAIFCNFRLPKLFISRKSYDSWSSKKASVLEQMEMRIRRKQMKVEKENPLNNLTRSSKWNLLCGKDFFFFCWKEKKMNFLRAFFSWHYRLVSITKRNCSSSKLENTFSSTQKLTKEYTLQRSYLIFYFKAQINSFLHV